jgi:hypothetical protein
VNEAHKVHKEYKANKESEAHKVQEVLQATKAKWAHKVHQETRVQEAHQVHQAHPEQLECLMNKKHYSKNYLKFLLQRTLSLLKSR